MAMPGHSFQSAWPNWWQRREQSRKIAQKFLYLGELQQCRPFTSTTIFVYYQKAQRGKFSYEWLLNRKKDKHTDVRSARVKNAKFVIKSGKCLKWFLALYLAVHIATQYNRQPFNISLLLLYFLFWKSYCIRHCLNVMNCIIAYISCIIIVTLFEKTYVNGYTTVYAVSRIDGKNW